MVFQAIAAQLPQSNMYHFTFTKTPDGYKLTDPQYLTSFNPDGYNNQPCFIDEHSLYFTTNYYDSEQTEIAKMNLFEDILERVTYTKESEYSPRSVPGKNELSCVRVELSDTVQSLRIYPLDEIGFAKRYMNNTDNIGYYNWLNDEELVLFLVDEPHHTLAIAEAISERRKIILDKIGRSLPVDRNGNLYFVHKIEEDQWFIKMLDRSSNKLVMIVPALKGVEDFELLSGGRLLCGKASQLFIFDPNTDSDWKVIADLDKFGIHNIKRIKVYKNRLVLVNTPNRQM